MHSHTPDENRLKTNIYASCLCIILFTITCGLIFLTSCNAGLIQALNSDQIDLHIDQNDFELEVKNKEHYAVI